MGKPRHYTEVDQIPYLSAEEKELLRPVTAHFAMRIPSEYAENIHWNNPGALHRIVVPSPEELQTCGKLDASNEHLYTVLPGLEHKYSDTALMLVSDKCAALCRYCFRKRIFISGEEGVSAEADERIDYIQEHPEISNVILSGGDPLMLSTLQLEGLLSKLADIDHVRTIRIGSRILAFDPQRVLDDPKLIEMVAGYAGRKSLYLVNHFDHAREFFPKSVEGLGLFKEAGVTLLNQNPIIRGVNDTAGVLHDLYESCIDNQVAPYYSFICRPTQGNEAYAVPVEESFLAFNEAQQGLSGSTRTARLVMSHTTGKIEVLGVDREKTYFRYHRAADPSDLGKLVSFARNPRANWFDDYLDQN